MSFWNAVLLLIMIEVFNLLVHMVLPPGVMRKYASFVMGVLTVYALLGPMLSLVSQAGKQLGSGGMDIDLGQYEKIEWQDYLQWYMARRGGGQE
jgi:hypothetical protein